ncbi:hypothetical protein [Methylobacterium sp. ID0610]
MSGEADIATLLQLQAYAWEIWWRAAWQVPAALVREARPGLRDEA